MATEISFNDLVATQDNSVQFFTTSPIIMKALGNSHSVPYLITCLADFPGYVDDFKFDVPVFRNEDDQFIIPLNWDFSSVISLVTKSHLIRNASIKARSDINATVIKTATDAVEAYSSKGTMALLPFAMSLNPASFNKSISIVPMSIKSFGTEQPVDEREAQKIFRLLRPSYPMTISLDPQQLIRDPQVMGLVTKIMQLKKDKDKERKNQTSNYGPSSSIHRSTSDDSMDKAMEIFKMLSSKS